MTRSFGVLLLLGLFVLGGQPAQERPCTAGFETVHGAKEIQLSVPARIVRRLAEKAPVVGEVLRAIEVEITFLKSWTVTQAVCKCRPCCEQPQQQHLAVSLSGWAWVGGGRVAWSDAFSITKPGEPPPVDPRSSCTVATPQKEYSAQQTVFGIGLDLPIRFRQAEAEFGVRGVLDCKCTTRLECVGNVPPKVLPFGPIALDHGSTVEFVVYATDENGNLELIVSSKMEGALLAERVGEMEGSGYMAWQRFHLTYAGEEELIKTRVVIDASDKCNSTVGLTEDVFIFYPPVLSHNAQVSGWRDPWYDIAVDVYDPNFRGCPHPWEAVTVDVGAASGVTYSRPADRVFGCPGLPRDADAPREAYTRVYWVSVKPVKNTCPRWVELTARDQRGLQANPLKVEVPNRPPYLEQAGQVYTSRPGRTVSVSLVAQDPDGDRVSIAQTAGPGEVRGDMWHWTVPDPYWGPAWRLVGFVLEDSCGGKTRQYFHVRVLQPPRVSGAHVTVRPCREVATARASMWVVDPDTPVEELTLHIDDAPLVGISVEGKLRRVPGASSYGHVGVAELVVRVAPWATPKEYTIPIIVSDRDGGTSSANLTVRVVENQPPKASSLQAQTTLALTPEGLKREPVVILKGDVWDPEGDPVFIEGYGLPPTYAANLSAFLGSLVALYTPGGLTEEDLCYAAVHKDALVDAFTLTLRDACGARTEVPVKVFLRVEDKIPPKIVYPAQSKTVECDGKGNVGEFQAWLEGKGGAWAFDNCPCQVSWSHRIERREPGCGNAGTHQVTFIASDCSGNTSSTTATFRIVDTTKPTWAQPMPGDLAADCSQVPPPPEVAAQDTCDPSVAVALTEERVDGPCPHTYTLIRTWKAQDACGNSITHTQGIAVRDTTPPQLTVPGDVDLGCNPADTGPDAAGWATARDPCDTAPQVSYADSASTVGCRVTIERTWRATDACGNAAPPRVQRITYTQDAVPPVLAVPEDLTVECHQVPPVGTATATDSCNPAPKVEYLGEERIDGPCPYTYTLVRTWRATDACGNSVERSQTITVRDTTPPVLTVPPDVGLGCNPTDTGPDAAGWATAQDACDPSPEITYTDAFSTVGCTTMIERNWRATDACGNHATGVQRITYTADTAPPTITCPATITVSTCLPPGFWVWVPFGITAGDTCGAASLLCDRSGDWFQVGTTTPVVVNCTATDPCGNTASRVCSFLVTVRGNEPPVAWDEEEDAPTGVLCIPVPAMDPDGDPLGIEVFEPFPCGATWVQGNRVCYGTYGCQGWQIPPGTVARFMFRVTDRCGATASGWVYVRITCEICPTALPPEEGP